MKNKIIKFGLGMLVSLSGCVSIDSNLTREDYSTKDRSAIIENLGSGYGNSYGILPRGCVPPNKWAPGELTLEEAGSMRIFRSGYPASIPRASLLSPMPSPGRF